MADPRCVANNGDTATSNDTAIRLLIVEDDESIAELLITGLEREGFEVAWASDGRAALAAETPDLVLLDFGLPDLDGAEVARRVGLAPPTPVEASP